LSKSEYTDRDGLTNQVDRIRAKISSEKLQFPLLWSNPRNVYLNLDREFADELLVAGFKDNIFKGFWNMLIKAAGLSEVHCYYAVKPLERDEFDPNSLTL